MNPIYASDEQQLDFIGIGMEILRVARNELYLNMRSGCGTFLFTVCAGRADPFDRHGWGAFIFSSGCAC